MECIEQEGMNTNVCELFVSHSHCYLAIILGSVQCHSRFGALCVCAMRMAREIMQEGDYCD